MNQASEPNNWHDPAVVAYDQTIPRKIPGYGLLYELTADLMVASLEQKKSVMPKLLIVGAGGGQELVTLGAAGTSWRFTAVDASEPMLELAKRRSAVFSDRIRYEQADWETYSDEGMYDGATCLLVLHFVKGLHNKRTFLRRIAESLAPGASFCLAAIQGDPAHASFKLQLQAWKRYMLRNGISPEAFEEFAASLGSRSEPASDEQTIALLHECGFTEVSAYFGSFLITGYHCKRAAVQDTVYDG